MIGVKTLSPVISSWIDTGGSGVVALVQKSKTMVFNISYTTIVVFEKEAKKVVVYKK
jgi:hypothetical protein